jgi:hypothetical protein
MRKSCFFVFDSDSQYIACENVFSCMDPESWKVTFVIVGEFELKEVPKTVEVVKIRFVVDLYKEAIVTADTSVLGVYLTGSKLRTVRTLTNDFFESNGVRPIIFTGYNGVVLQKFEEGFSWRCGYDLIAMNSSEDLIKAENFLAGGTNIKKPRLPIIGIKRIRLGDRELQALASRSKLKQIVFTEQVVFPKSSKEKAALYCHLIRIALLNPDWRIIIKPRTLPGSKTFHRQAQHISDFLDYYFKLPSNLVISYQPLSNLLPVSSALISVSSTALFDGLSYSVPSFTITDFGISSAYGTHYFYGSGCMIRLADISVITTDFFQRFPSKEWQVKKGFSNDLTPKSLISEIDDLLNSGCHRSELPTIMQEQQRAIKPFHIQGHTKISFRKIMGERKPYPGKRVCRYFEKRFKNYLNI